MTAETPTARLDRIVDEFADLDPRERLELLIEFAENLAPLPARLSAERDAEEHRVRECQTPVSLWVEIQGGRVRIYGVVAAEAPTVQGFVGLLIEVFSGAGPDEVLAVEPDVLHRLGLASALGMVRTRGMNAIVKRIREEVELAA